MDTLRRSSAIVFYVLGAVVIVSITVVLRGIWEARLMTLLNILDLPMILVGMLFGGLSLAHSLSRERASPLLLALIFVPLAAVFGFFCYLNFALPFASV